MQQTMSQEHQLLQPDLLWQDSPQRLICCSKSYCSAISHAVLLSSSENHINNVLLDQFWGFGGFAWLAGLGGLSSELRPLYLAINRSSVKGSSCVVGLRPPAQFKYLLQKLSNFNSPVFPIQFVQGGMLKTVIQIFHLFPAAHQLILIRSASRSRKTKILLTSTEFSL